MSIRSIEIRRILLFALSIFLILSTVAPTSVVVRGDDDDDDGGGAIHVPGDFGTIQEAVDAAGPGATIQVKRGTYSENVVITQAGLRLHGQKAVLEGAGSGVGIHVLDTTGVRVSGFTVRNFEVGIRLENTTHSRLHRNVVSLNTSADGSLRDGIQLVNAHHNILSKNVSNENGHNGFTLRMSTNNKLIGNVANDNGTQLLEFLFGCGIQFQGGGNDHNLVLANTTLTNGWGIQTTGPVTGNVVAQNRSHGNGRAGVAILGGAGNVIVQNDARGNGLGNRPPSLQFDLFDDSVAAPGDVPANTWLRNKGTANF